jgi:hypothetical protein
VRQYLRDVEANEYDPGDLEQAWKKVAQECGWIIEGNARDFFLMVGKSSRKTRLASAAIGATANEPNKLRS